MNLAKKHFIIITGLSGAGKTQASKVFEDILLIFYFILKVLLKRSVLLWT